MTEIQKSHVNFVFCSEEKSSLRIKTCSSLAAPTQLLASFLLNLARKFEARGFSKSEFVLRMTRGELGSFLGLKLETVSRTLTHFDELNLIEINQRHVRIINLEGLKAVAKESGRAKRKTSQE